MIDLNERFEEQCEEYLAYLYELAEHKYRDCGDIDTLVQDSMMAFVVRIKRGITVEHPKGFLSAVMKNKYNSWLRQKYKNYASSCDYPETFAAEDELEKRDAEELLNDEYESVRREIGRLVRIYREVTVRHYVRGQSVEQISKELNIPRGTVLSRLAAARKQIKDGLKNMEKYSQITYEPKHVMLGIWGGTGLNQEPFSLITSDIEANMLVLAYENPVSVRGIADTMGMPTTYVEQIVKNLVKGELMGQTSSGLVYTRCFMQRYEDSLGDIPSQEALAKKYAKTVWATAWKYFEPLTNRDAFVNMSGKQKATLLLILLTIALNHLLMQVKPVIENEPKHPPERPNGGRWLAIGTIFDDGQITNMKYSFSGPEQVFYSKANDANDCRMLDCQTVFGGTHYKWSCLKYKCSAMDVLKLLASHLPCGVHPEGKHWEELLPDFEKLHILHRDENGNVVFDIPTLTIAEISEYWNPTLKKIADDLDDIMRNDLQKIWQGMKVRIPKYIDGRERFLYGGVTMNYVIAQLLEIIDQGIFPFPVTIGETPLMYVAYRPEETK